MSEIRIKLRDYLEDQERARRDWMAATFATKDDLGTLRQEVAGLRGQRQAAWGAAGTFVGAVIVGLLSFLGIRVPGGQ